MIYLGFTYKYVPKYLQKKKKKIINHHLRQALIYHLMDDNEKRTYCCGNVSILNVSPQLSLSAKPGVKGTAVTKNCYTTAIVFVAA